MYALPAEIPAAEVARSDLVEARVARKVGPLFGIPSATSPFARSWVCDYATLSLAEIGRGAPYPARDEQSRLDLVDPPDGPGWLGAGSAVWTPRRGPTPGMLSNATLNRFGPDTKAAAVLTGANRLLRGPTAAVAAVSRHLCASDTDARIKLAVWAGLVLEVYRSQPALVVAAVQARLVQRSLSARWGDHLDASGLPEGSAPSELDPRAPTDPGDDPGDPRWRPTSFDLIDGTLPLLGVCAEAEAEAGAQTVTDEARDDLTNAWCQRLLALGRPGRGLVWLAEDDGGARQAHAYVRVGSVVAPFVAQVLGEFQVRRLPRLPPLPAPAAFSAMPVLDRRAHLLATHVLTNYLRYRDDLLQAWPDLRPVTRRLIAEAVERCAQLPEKNDPVAVQLQAYACYLELWDHLRTTPDSATSPTAGSPTAEDLAADDLTARLLASQEETIAAWRAGWIDPGAVTYLLEIGAVALRRAATRAAEPVAAEPTAAGASHAQASGTGRSGTGRSGTRHDGPGQGDRAAARRHWAAILTARGLDPETDLAAGIDSLTGSQRFHLHHFADHVASGGRRVDLERALTIQESVTAVRDGVVRGEPARLAAKHTSARVAHELAADIARRLAAAVPARERAPRERALAAAVRHATAVLSDPTAESLLRASDAGTTEAARSVGQAFLAAAEGGIDLVADDVSRAIALLDAAPALSALRDQLTRTQSRGETNA
jgi:hypothetical protein